ncbi:Ger(x)C family spore germination protein [Bacillus sp. CHD6a]|uniref:Ger(x)C family spore germination protein n=1 Tax=Bacillus sp. CHD6a TaxID=1643452 RepID=UPI0006CD1C40|nr:Ger(x)C family spore germination protein [Bacillus sp. CHD6a]KPB06286.1 hypothetical protein AAV98_00320 [Bacillus sp. CHD6a]
MRIILILLVLLLSACGERKQIVEELALINVISYDLSENEEEPLQVTINYPIINNEGELTNDILSVQSKSSKDARMKFTNLSNLQVVSGQVHLALLGRELAEKGILQILDTFKRDPNIGSHVNLAIAEDNGFDLLTFESKEGDSSASYLLTMFNKLKAEKESVNYHTFQFFRDYYDDGIDPFLPIVSIKDNKQAIVGYGLFKKDKYVEKINMGQSLILFYLRDDINKGIINLNVSVGEEEEDDKLLQSRVTFDYKKSDSNTSVKIKNDTVELKKNVELEISLLEYTGSMNLSEEKNQKIIEKKIEEYLNNRTNEFMGQLQEFGCDPIGIGKYVRNHMTYQQWQETNWDQLYSSMDINIKSKVKIMDFGKAK